MGRIIAGVRAHLNGPLASVASFGPLLALAYIIYERIFEIRPLSGDNLYILTWADRTPVSELFRVDPAIYPEWRPLAYQTIWFQYLWSDIDNLKAYYLVNLIVWTACAWFIYRIVDLLADSKPAGMLAAAITVTDDRAIWPLIWIVERQSSMACFFGLAAILLVVVIKERRLTRVEWTCLLLLALASALSKEYGLAFAGALLLYSLFARRYGVATAAVAAGVLYAGLRLLFAGAATGRYCEEMGYFFSSPERVCFDGLDIAAIKQMAYNVAAALTGSLLPGLLTEKGQIEVSLTRFALGTMWLGVAAIGWIKGPRSIWITILAVLLSAGLNFMVYRSRNHLIAICALNIAIGVGLAILLSCARARLPAWRIIRYPVLAFLLLLVAEQAIRSRGLVSPRVDGLSSRDPCKEVAEHPHLDSPLIRRIKLKYGMSNPDCAPEFVSQ